MWPPLSSGCFGYCPRGDRRGVDLESSQYLAPSVCTARRFNFSVATRSRACHRSAFFLVTLVLLILKMISQMVCPEAVGSLLPLLAWSLLLGRWEVTLLVLPCSGVSRGWCWIPQGGPQSSTCSGHAGGQHSHFIGGKVQRGDVTGQGPQLGIEPRPSG